MERKNRGIFWSVKVPVSLNDQLDKYIKTDAFETKSEFIRQAVRDKLREETKKPEAVVPP
jgi:Arc/MetJ-type ribon-helix-helix transcriptional regulator